MSACILPARPKTEYIYNRNRTGRNVTTLRNQYSENKTFLSDDTYKLRTQPRVWTSYLGARPIHRTTLTLDRSRPKLDYGTIYKHVCRSLCVYNTFMYCGILLYIA